MVFFFNNQFSIQLSPLHKWSLQTDIHFVWSDGPSVQLSDGDGCKDWRNSLSGAGALVINQVPDRWMECEVVQLKFHDQG